MKRTVLFLATNVAILLVLSFSARILGIDRYLANQGLNMGLLLGFAALIGFGGSFAQRDGGQRNCKQQSVRVVQQPPPDRKADCRPSSGRMNFLLSCETGLRLSRYRLF